MSGSLAKSAAPPWAVTMWTDEKNLYAEIPGKDRPYITVLALNEGGLSKGLSLLRTRSNASAAPVYRTDANARITNRVLVGNAAQRANAASVLRKMGILP